MSRKSRTLLLALVAVFLLAMLAALFLPLGRTPPPPLPNPNGYDDFLKAAALLTGDVGNADTLDHDGLRALVSTNSESLRLLRLGLTRQCAFPADSAMTNVAWMLSDLVPMKQLVQLLEAEGRLRDLRSIEAVRNVRQAKVWSILNMLSNDHGLDHAAGRQARRALWDRVRRLCQITNAITGAE